MPSPSSFDPTRDYDQEAKDARIDAPSTQWERMLISTTTREHLRGTHRIWSRLMDREHIFTVLPNDSVPGDNDGGYRSINAALKVKGML